MLSKAAITAMATLRLARPAARLAAPAAASRLLALRWSALAGGRCASSLLAERLQDLHTWHTVAAAAQPAIASSAAASTAEDAEHQGEERRYAIVNFYHLVDIERPHEVINQHKEWMEGRDVRGRIYISEQGINAQYGGAYDDAVAYAKWLAETQPLFKGLRYTVFPVDNHMYPRLRLQYKPNLISLAGGMRSLPMTDPSSRATPVEPAEWRRMLSQAQAIGRKPIVLDVRNDYEWDAGHFVGAERPLESEFNETPTESTPAKVPPYLENADPNTPIMMYCTGGIRCDVYSTYLRQKGFNKLYTLEGGIQNYMRKEGLEHWNGSLFVFDGRMAIRPNKDSEEPLVAAAPCSVCGGEAVLPHSNCGNIDCNKLFIACEACRARLNGCCCESCMDAPRLLRPAKTAGTYGTWTQYTNDTEAIAKGRGPGRLSRRRKRLAAQRKRELSKRQQRVARRHVGKEAMAARDLELACERGDGSDAAAELTAVEAERAARLARLAELRARLASDASAVRA